MRMLSFLLGVALFIVAGFTQNALIGIVSIILSILAMLWPVRDEAVPAEYIKLSSKHELSSTFPLLPERSPAMRLSPESMLDNMKDPEPKGNYVSVPTALMTRRNLDE